MIATVRFTVRGKPLTADLSDGGEWSCPDPVIAEFLNLMADGVDRSPARGAPYHAHVAEVARVLNGRAEFEAKDPGPPGRVY